MELTSSFFRHRQDKHKINVISENLHLNIIFIYSRNVSSTFSTVSFEREASQGTFQRATTPRHLANTRRTIPRQHSLGWSEAQVGREGVWQGGLCSRLRQPRGLQSGPGRCRCDSGVSILRNRASLPPASVRVARFALSDEYAKPVLKNFVN